MFRATSSLGKEPYSLKVELRSNLVSVYVFSSRGKSVDIFENINPTPGVSGSRPQILRSLAKNKLKKVSDCDSQMSVEEILDCIFDSLDCDVFFKLMGHLEKTSHEISYSQDIETN